MNKIKNEEEIIPCPVCESEEISAYPSFGSIERQYCRNCGVILVKLRKNIHGY